MHGLLVKFEKRTLSQLRRAELEDDAVLVASLNLQLKSCADAMDIVQEMARAELVQLGKKAASTPQ